MSMYGEIVTKAVIGKGKVGKEEELVLQPEKKLDKVLGCWIINNHYVSVFENGKVYIDGAYDVNLWYAYDDERKTALFEKNIKYKGEVAITMKKEEQVKEDSEIKSTCVKYPTCTSLKLDDNKNVIATVNKEFKVDVIGETKLKVQVSSFDDEEWILEEEIEKNSKAKHLTYLGDSKIGKNTNIGCGVISANFDGFKKSETIIEDDCMVGANVTLIAPIKVGNNSVLAAGSTINQDVSPYSLAIARSRQVNKEGRYKKSL